MYFTYSRNRVLFLDYNWSIQNKQLARQKSLVEEKNQEFLDSVTYAKRIQLAVLPSRKSFEEFLGNPVVFLPLLLLQISPGMEFWEQW